MGQASVAKLLMGQALMMMEIHLVLRLSYNESLYLATTVTTRLMRVWSNYSSKSWTLTKTPKWSMPIGKMMTTKRLEFMVHLKKVTNKPTK